MSGFVTEDDAKTKWCPMAVPPTNMAKCIGSACMMWRTPGITRVAATGEVLPAAKFMQAIHDGIEMETVWADYGYCGLAGRPGA